ncbi:uncharacterized protein BP5553_10425 [Venustampulla echinocandica]|uniref:Uncharacterized protein n=1 Tax=Venustampulla echinocandica TaxID=2656787 RepID=A0A370T994_9HELO|nr:uncharacterized protein BP5553_10425 [Venustampulla echinocandica]RDL30147.1 hypothetical protein BP5553_10425 [Venustampulla echinocandica]
MAYTAYPHCLPVDVYDGYINNINVKWSPTTREWLPQKAVDCKTSVQILKSLTEHYLYLSAHRMGSTQVTVKSTPHDFTIDSKTGQQTADGMHVSGRMVPGQYHVHVYIEGVNATTTPYERMTWVGEGVTKAGKKGKPPTFYHNLSCGTYPGAANSGATSTSGHAATSGYTHVSTMASSAAGPSGQASTSSYYPANYTPATATAYPIANVTTTATTAASGWIWNNEYQKYYRVDPKTGLSQWHTG